MSIVTLKKNSKRFQDKISGKLQGFSLNGGYRNQGWIGQDTLGRHISYTPFRGIAPIGHGGTDGHYVINVVQGGSNSSNDHTIIKRSTMNTKGHLFSTIDYPTSIFNTSCSSNKCKTIWVKKFCPEQRSQGIYIYEKSQKFVCVVIKPNICIDKIYCKDENNIDIIKSDRRSYCKYGYYRIGGKKIYRRSYSKNFNPLPMSSSQYTKTALMTKNNLPTPPCKASYPPVINHIGNCDLNFNSPQDAINAGVLPLDWMNCKPCSKSARPYTTTFNSYPLQCNISIKNFNCQELANLDGQFINNLCPPQPQPVPPPPTPPTPPCDFFTRDELLLAIADWVADRDAATLTYGLISSWNVSCVTDFSFIFSDQNAPGFGTDPRDNVNPWDTSNVINMAGVFQNQANFNNSLDNWVTDNVTNMSEMFINATIFNQPLNSWNVSSVTNMSYMFTNAREFNQPLNSWNVSSVTNMSFMFAIADKFNQPLDTWIVSSVTNMENMFNSARIFNQPLNSWNVSSVTNMRNMFTNTNEFNQPLNSWNVSSVTNMSAMFAIADKFNQPLDTWNVSSVTNFDDMFNSAIVFNQNIRNWVVQITDSLFNMFLNASAMDVVYNGVPGYAATPTIDFFNQ